METSYWEGRFHARFTSEEKMHKSISMREFFARDGAGLGAGLTSFTYVQLDPGRTGGPRRICIRCM